MEPRPPKPPRSAPRQPQQRQPQQPWDQTGQPAPGQPPAGGRREGGYPGANRYPDYPPYDQQQPPAYPPTPNYPAPGYGQQPPNDPYAGYQRPIYPPSNPQGGYPAQYPGNQPDPYAGYGGQQPYPTQPGAYPPAVQPGQTQAPVGRPGSAGWIAPLPDEDLTSIQPSTYGGGYGGGGFSGDPRSSRPAAGPNRQTQIIAALAIGGLALMILAIVIGFIVFGGDDDKKNDPTPQAGLVTDLTPTTTGETAPTATTEAGAAETPTVAATETVTQESQQTEPTAEPTQAPTEESAPQNTAGLFQGDGDALLPTAEELPQSNFIDNTTDARYTRADVAASLGEAGGGPINDELRANGFASNWRRQFTLNNPEPPAADTSVFLVTVTIFRNAQGAADSYHLFEEAAAANNYQTIDGESLGDRSTTMQFQGEGTATVIYVLKGNVIFRIYGYSAGGDPGADVLALTQTVLAKMP